MFSLYIPEDSETKKVKLTPKHSEAKGKPSLNPDRNNKRVNFSPYFNNTFFIPKSRSQIFTALRCNKKVLLRERKRHTARRVAIAISCYSRGVGGGKKGGRRGSLDKNFFSSLNMYQAKSGVKKFSLYWGGGGPSTKKFFSSLNMYQAKSGVKKFSLYWGWGGGPLPKIFFSSLNMYQAKSGVKKFSLYWGGGGGGLSTKNFFSSLNMYQAKSGVKKFSPLLRPGPPPLPRLDQPIRKSET